QLIERHERHGSGEEDFDSIPIDVGDDARQARARSIENAFLPASREYERIHDDRVRASVTVNASDTLFHLHWVPWNIEVHQPSGDLKIDPFSTRSRRDQNSHASVLDETGNRAFAHLRLLATYDQAD